MTRPCSLSVAVALSQDNMPVHEFVVASVLPEERPFYNSKFGPMIDASEPKPDWERYVRSSVGRLTAREFIDAYLKPLPASDSVLADTVLGVLSPFFKTGVVTPCPTPDGMCVRDDVDTPDHGVAIPSCTRC